jgi:hypothetical protein
MSIFYFLDYMILFKWKSPNNKLVDSTGDFNDYCWEHFYHLVGIIRCKFDYRSFILPGLE